MVEVAEEEHGGVVESWRILRDDLGELMKLGARKS